MGQELTAAGDIPWHTGVTSHEPGEVRMDKPCREAELRAPCTASSGGRKGFPKRTELT